MPLLNVLHLGGRWEKLVQDAKSITSSSRSHHPGPVVLALVLDGMWMMIGTMVFAVPNVSS